VRTFQAQPNVLGLAYPMPSSWKSPCYKIRGSTLRNAQFGSEELQEMKELRLQAGTCPGNAAEHPGATELVCSRRIRAGAGRALATPEHKPALSPRAVFARGRERGEWA
jgi:hypothetical protein